MASPLSGQGAFVTGASSGIGRAIARRLAADGATVWCADRTPAARAGGYDRDVALSTYELIRRGGGAAHYVSIDAGDERSVDDAVAAAASGPLPFRICVLNAGVFLGDATILEETAAVHDETMRVNERGVWLGCRAAARAFVAAGDGGRIVCVASTAGLVGLPDEPAYCASKAAVIGLVRAAALDLAHHRIGVNAVCPGFVATALAAPSLRDEAVRRRLEERTPWPRLGRPEDVENAVAFLASPAAEWITGSILAVDGGYTCR